jgi:hypothetical protein
MGRFAAIAIVALATTGCIGSSADSTVAPSSDSNLAVRWSRTVVTITYYAPHCPPGASCSPYVESNSSAQIVRVVRNLFCDPAHSADYDNAPAACRALTDIVTKQRQQQSQSGPVIICRCVMTRDAPKAVGYYNGKRRTIRLDGCSLCNLKGIGADLAVLLPGAEG